MILALLVTATLVVTACGGSGGAATDSTSEQTPTIVATTSIWADVVSNLAWDGVATVRTLIPVGGDPHGFEPSLADRGEMERAALVVANGLSLEEGIGDTIAAVESGGTPVFRVAEHVATIEYPSGGDDPHIWLDPRRVSTALEDLADVLVAELGADARTVAGCLARYQAELSAADATIEVRLEAVSAGDRSLVTNHDSLGYFADRYGFDVVGTVIPAPTGLAESSPARLEELAERIETTGAGAIFVETQHSGDAAAALARSLDDVAVVTLFTGTLGNADSDASSYLALLIANADLIAASLE
jgi:zinc/manganese transport system substrate-binding protein